MDTKGTGPHPFAELIGLELSEQTPGHSLCRVETNEKLWNPQKVVHGGVLYALADTGMGGALYPTLQEGELCATIEIKISYFKPVRIAEIVCESRVLQRGKRVAALESTLHADGELVAKATGSFSIFAPGRVGEA